MSDETSASSCETGSHYEGDFSYFPKDSYHLETRMNNPDKPKGTHSITCPECNKDVHVHHFEWTSLKCQHCGAVVANDKWQMKGDFSYSSRMEKLGDREGTYDYYLRRMKEENALKKQVGGEHYKDCNIQPVEYIFQNDLDYFEGNVVKYITRHRKKGEGKKDVEKAIHYAQLILELFYNEQANNV